MEIDLTPESDAAAAAGTQAAVPSTAATVASSTPSIPTSHALLYSLMIRQLQDDGLTQIAQQLSTQTRLGLDVTYPPHQLARLVESALRALHQEFEAGGQTKLELGRPEDAVGEQASTTTTSDQSTGDEEEMKDAAAADESKGMNGSNKSTKSDAFTYLGLSGSSSLLDLTAHSTISTLSTPFPTYQLRFTFGHTDSLTCATFSSDGGLAATGSRDTSIKLVDVARMRMAGTIASAATAVAAASGRIAKKGKADSTPHPLLRTYFDHEAPISELKFHPFEPFLLSGSRDQTLKLYNYAPALSGTIEDIGTGSVALSRKCTKVLALENAPVTSIDFHPSGDFVLVATEQNFTRLYDVQTFSAYVSNDFSNFHAGSITTARFHPLRGSTYVTASTDGTVKIWDGMTNMLVHTLTDVHSGGEVSSVEYSPSGKYLLTSGLDSTAKLWDLSTYRLLTTYQGAKHEHTHIRTQFEHSGEFILSGDEAVDGLAVFDTRTAELVRRFDTAARTVKYVGVSPTEAAFITCGGDGKGRFYCV